jgi:hypothetical protein
MNNYDEIKYRFKPALVSGERVKVNHIHNNNTSLKEDNKFPITKTTSYI